MGKENSSIMGTDKNDTDVWPHKQCKGIFFENYHLDKQINTTSIQNDKSDEFHSEVVNTPEATKISVKRQSVRKKYRYVSLWKNKDLMKCIICDEQKLKQDVFYLWLIYHSPKRQKKPCENLCLPQAWLTIALVIKHFDAQGGKNNFTKLVTKNKN